MTDDLEFRIGQLKREGIKVLDSEDTILDYSIFVDGRYKIVFRSIYFTLFFEGEQIVKNDNFSVIIKKLKHI